MTDTFDVNSYWLQRGRAYDSETRLAGGYHRLQQLFLVDVLKLARIPTGRILEIGCGFGRITKVLADSFPKAAVTAVDLSPEQLANAQRHCAGCLNVSFAPYDLYSGQPVPSAPVDLIVASEVFLHHPAAKVSQFLSQLAPATQFILNIDWCEDWQGPVSEHVWIHNYRALYQRAGLESAGFPLPQRIDGKQQRLFVAGRQLTEELVHLERLVTCFGCDSAEPPWKVEDETPRAKAPGEWKDAIQAAVDELCQKIPDGDTLVMAEDGQWPAGTDLGRRRMLPFLERDGLWWGPPESDEVAMSELERLRQAGARWFVLAWPSFWWMEHYTGFLQHVRQQYPCILRNDRVILFDLRGGTGPR